MTEEDFESKRHVTKHMTLNRYGWTEEVTRVNSWPEQDYLSWKMYLARTLTPENVTPATLKTICDASKKYSKAFGSYKFGIVQGIKSKWVVLMVIAIIGFVLFLYMTGNIEVS